MKKNLFPQYNIDALKIDFLSIKTIFFYLLTFGVILVSGRYLKDVFVLLIVFLVIINCLTKNFYRSLEIILIWFIVYGFYTSQGFITSVFISKYIAKPYFLLFFIFIFFLEGTRKASLDKTYLTFWFFYLIIVFLGSSTQFQSIFVVISQSAFILIYFLIKEKKLSIKQYQNLLNLFVAAAVLQTIVSILQVSEIIPPASKMMADGQGGIYLWSAGLDDVASGTFGAGASHIASWYAGFISLFLLLIWIITKNRSYLFFILLSFLQCATVDSKTIMGVMILMMGYLMFYLFKRKTMFQFDFQKTLLSIVAISFIGFVFVTTWDAYYNYYGKKTGGSRTSINEVYETEINVTMALVLNNIIYWGKIRGFEYVFNDFIDNDAKRLIWGYGIQGYDYNDKMKFIENKDPMLMQLNNFTRSRSGLISLFAKVGLVGSTLFFIALYFWYKINNSKISNKFDLIKVSLLHIFSLFSLLAAALYAIEITSVPIIIFAATISIYSRLSVQHNIHAERA